MGEVPPALALDVEDAQTTRQKQGGWITFPFITGSLAALTLAISGATTNLIVYLIKQYNFKSIDAAQTFNIVNGCINVAPLLGAVISDSYFGCFPVVAVSTFLSLLGMVLFTLSATIPSLTPTLCGPGTSSCKAASTPQLAVLFAAVALTCVAAGGTRFTTVTMGADQFDTPLEQDIFINWYFVALYASFVAGATVLVYVEDNVGWSWGFGACTAASAVSLVALLLGTRHYRQPRPVGSPFTGLLQVVVAAARKWNITRVELAEYYHGPGVPREPPPATGSLSCLNRAAVMAEGDTNPDGSLAKPWRLCTVMQVEDLKTILRILPLWSTSIFLSISIGIQGSLSVLQALTVDRSLGPHFSVPAGSVIVSSFVATAISLSLLDRFFFPVWRKLVNGRNPTPLQRVGLGHVLNAAAMAVSALVERRRMQAVRTHHLAPAGGSPGSLVPMSILWLLLPLVVVGVGEAMHFPGQVALYYQEFPSAFRSSATGMIALIVALGFYLSTAVIDLVRKLTDWLPDDLNTAKVDRLYWLLAGVGVLNFGAYVLLARAYKYQSVPEKEKDNEGAKEEVVGS